MTKLGSRHQNLDQKVYQAVKTMILERKLTPGTKILQDKLAMQLGVSRTPVVNALKILEHEKLITSKPRRGFFVRLFSKVEMVNIFELREVLEGLAARRAAICRTERHVQELHYRLDRLKTCAYCEHVKAYAEEDRHFHNFLIAVGGKEFLSSILDTYNIITISHQFQQHEGLVRAPQETIDEHAAIVEAISRQEPLYAEEMARLHSSRSTQKLMEELEMREEGLIECISA